jgi:hypothetical protein
MNEKEKYNLTVKYPKLALLFDVLCFIEVIILAVVLIMMVWEKDNVQMHFLIRLAASDFIALIASVILFRFCCYYVND